MVIQGTPCVQWQMAYGSPSSGRPESEVNVSGFVVGHRKDADRSDRPIDIVHNDHRSPFDTAVDPSPFECHKL